MPEIIKGIKSWLKLEEIYLAWMDSANLNRPQDLNYRNLIEVRNRRIALAIGVFIVGLIYLAKDLI